MTPEQLEEIPGIGEKTLEKISVAVRHYFGQFAEGEEGRAPEVAEPIAGEAEVETAPEVVGDAEAEAENAAVVLEEAESIAAVEAESAEETEVESANEEAEKEEGA